MKDYAIVSLHEKGFWQVDIYWKLERPPEEGDVPDHFKTFKIGQDMQAPLQWCEDWYKNAEVLIAGEDDNEDDEPDSPADRKTEA